MDIEKQILNPIDEALEANSQVIGQDASLRLQEEVWAQIEEGVGHEYDMDEALRRYRAWHNSYCIGHTAVKA